MEKNISSKILNNIVLLGITLTICLLLFLPLGFTAFFKSNFGIVGSNIPIILSVGVYVCAIPYLVALISLKKLCSLIANKDPFSRQIPYHLKTISICAFSEILIFNVVQLFLCYFFNVYFYALNIIPAILVSFISLAIGFLSLVLGRLYTMAIEIKEENDKTI